jgi:Fe-S cluster assembly iron-binding protein IscA
VTQAALDRVAQLMQDEPAGTMLRVSVEGGGCSGFQYKYELTQEQLDDDVVLGDETVSKCSWMRCPCPIWLTV